MHVEISFKEKNNPLATTNIVWQCIHKTTFTIC